MAMSDQRLAEVIVRRKELDRQIKVLQERDTKLRDRIKRELQRRGAPRFEHDMGGGRIVKATLVQPTEVRYNFNFFLNKSRRLASRLRPDRVDPEKLAELVVLGELSDDDVTAGSEVVEKSAYVLTP